MKLARLARFLVDFAVMAPPRKQSTLVATSEYRAGQLNTCQAIHCAVWRIGQLGLARKVLAHDGGSGQMVGTFVSSSLVVVATIVLLGCLDPSMMSVNDARRPFFRKSKSGLLSTSSTAAGGGLLGSS